MSIGIGSLCVEFMWRRWYRRKKVNSRDSLVSLLKRSMRRVDSQLDSLPFATCHADTNCFEHRMCLPSVSDTIDFSEDQFLEWQSRFVIPSFSHDSVEDLHLH